LERPLQTRWNGAAARGFDRDVDLGTRRGFARDLPCELFAGARRDRGAEAALAEQADPRVVHCDASMVRSTAGGTACCRAPSPECNAPASPKNSACRRCMVAAMSS